MMAEAPVLMKSPDPWQIPLLGFWSSCGPEASYLRMWWRQPGCMELPPTCSPAEEEPKTHQAAWSPIGPVTSEVVGPEPRFHFSASITLIVGLAASLGQGLKKLIELPGLALGIAQKGLRLL